MQTLQRCRPLHSPSCTRSAARSVPKPTNYHWFWPPERVANAADRPGSASVAPSVVVGHCLPSKQGHAGRPASVSWAATSVTLWSNDPVTVFTQTSQLPSDARVQTNRSLRKAPHGRVLRDGRRRHNLETGHCRPPGQKSSRLGARLTTNDFGVRSRHRRSINNCPTSTHWIARASPSDCAFVWRSSRPCVSKPRHRREPGETGLSLLTGRCKRE